MPVTLEHGARTLALRRGRIAVEVDLDPLAIRVIRGPVELISDLRLAARAGSGGDRFVQVTEGVVVEEERGPAERAQSAEPISGAEPGIELHGHFDGGRELRLRVALPADDHVLFELHAGAEPFRLEAGWDLEPGEAVTGLGVRHGEPFDQRGRVVRLGADRRYTGPDCPEDLLEEGGVPMGDYVPAPWLLLSGGLAAWLETGGPGVEFDLTGGVTVSQRAAAGPLRLHLLCSATPVSRLRQYLRLTGMPPVLPEWAYGHWKSRDVYEHERDVIDDFDGYRGHDLPLDAIVIDSPWETQYNTWRFNPLQFPNARELIGRMRADGVRTVVWVTPWVNLESADGQYPRDPESERMHRRPAFNYGDGAIAGHYVRRPDGQPWVGRWWMGTGSIVDFSSQAARRWWQALARPILEMGVEGVKADDGEGYYLPPDSRLADGRSGAEAAWAYGDLYRRTMQEVLEEVHPGSGVLFGRSGWSGQQATGVTWGGDQASDFWSLRTLVAATLTAAASGFSNWSHDVGGYLGKRLVERCPPELLARWVQFGCFTPLMQSHGRFSQEAWHYDPATLETYRSYVLLHERLVPYVRAAAATSERSGVPIIRPLCLTDPADRRGWQIRDAYGFGPALWVAPVVEEGARERSVELPAGEWIDWWSRESVVGGGLVTVAAPVERIPVFVRAGSIVVTHPGEHVARGLGDVPEHERPLEATLWGRPRLGRTGVRLADGTLIRWAAGRWSVDGPEREISFAEVAN